MAFSIGPRFARLLLAAALLVFAPGQASAQTVRVVATLSLMTGLAGAPAFLQPAAGPIASLSPAASFLTLTPTALPLPLAPTVLRAAPAALTVQAPQNALVALRAIDWRIQDAPAPAQAHEWRRYFDGGLKTSPDTSVTAEPLAADRGQGLAPSAPRAALPALGLSVQPSPAPEIPQGWKKMIHSHAFWLAVAAIVPGGFLVLGAFWLYKLIAARLRRRRA
jgi:hypothetical protein